MKKLIILFLTFIFLTSCGVSINSIVDSSAVKEPYINPLVVITYEKYSTRNFSERLKDNLEIEFSNANKKVDFLIIEQKSEKLTLNENDNINSKIEKTILEKKNDIILIFNPSNLSYYNGGLQSATYKLTGIDVETQKEVWKAELNSSSSFGPALFAKAAAKKILEKLKTNKVL